MHFLALSTDNELCGIATYNGHLREAIVSLGHQYDVFPIDTKLFITRAKSELKSYFEPFTERCRLYDAIVIQHEYGIYNAGYGLKESLTVFSNLLRRVAAIGKPIVVIFHSDPPHFPKRPGPRILQKLSSGRRAWASIVRVIRRSQHIQVVVHGPESRRRFVDRGFPVKRVNQILHPFPAPAAASSDWLPKDAQKSEIVLTIFGFVARYKGYETAIQALSLLPSSYRLVIAGGPHPRAVGDKTLDHLLEVLGIGRFSADVAPIGANAGMSRRPPRVVITGWLSSEELDKVLKGTDIILAPYTDDGPAGSGAVTWGLSAGRPVIATKTRAFLELNRIAPCMRLVSPNAPFELAREILSLASDPLAQQQMVNEARRLAAHHDWKHAASRMLSLLEVKA